MPAERLRFSTFSAVSMISFAAPPAPYASRSSGDVSSALCSPESRPMMSGGYIFVRRSPSAYGKPSTRAASLIACFPLIVPYVTIWATWSSPYFWHTYLMTSPRLRSSKSMSMSGIAIRSGLRNRSNMRS
jgi:hypothetical protein